MHILGTDLVRSHFALVCSHSPVISYLSSNRIIHRERLRDSVLVLGAHSECVFVVRLETHHVVMAVADERRYLHPDLEIKHWLEFDERAGF